jgi:hypothetical protein
MLHCSNSFDVPVFEWQPLHINVQMGSAFTSNTSTALRISGARTGPRAAAELSGYVASRIPPGIGGMNAPVEIVAWNY